MVDLRCIRLALLAQDKFSNCGFTSIRRFRGEKQMAECSIIGKSEIELLSWKFEAITLSLCS